jgi:hypothetical protein
MSGALLFSLYAFMAWTRIIFNFFAFAVVVFKQLIGGQREREAGGYNGKRGRVQGDEPTRSQHLGSVDVNTASVSPRVA